VEEVEGRGLEKGGLAGEGLEKGEGYGVLTCVIIVALHTPESIANSGFLTIVEGVSLTESVLPKMRLFVVQDFGITNKYHRRRLLKKINP
jgi:hypothetical protein